jgi:hypothetical protein
MNKNLTNEEFVSSYLDNELPEIERLDFENKLLHDSELKEEFNFQKDLIDGIKEGRRLELKSRLSEIPVNTPLYQTIAFKSITVASISAGIGLGAYFMLTDRNDIQISDIDINTDQITLVEENQIPEIPKAIIPIIKGEPMEEKTIEITYQEKPKSEPLAKNTETVTEPKIIQPNVVRPNVVDYSFEDEDINTIDEGIDGQIDTFEKVNDNTENSVEVSTTKDKRNKFHYKFFENKLFLLGNFNDTPYEIIELNSSKGKSYFLYYDYDFYKLNSEQVKPAPLVKIENDSLINELKIIQLNQNN